MLHHHHNFLQDDLDKYHEFYLKLRKNLVPLDLDLHPFSKDKQELNNHLIDYFLDFFVHLHQKKIEMEFQVLMVMSYHLEVLFQFLFFYI